jgi:hypothetical protein
LTWFDIDITLYFTGIIGARTSGVIVKTILAGGVADRDGRLKSGDHILQIGDVSNYINNWLIYCRPLFYERENSNNNFCCYMLSVKQQLSITLPYWPC